MSALRTSRVPQALAWLLPLICFMGLAARSPAAGGRGLAGVAAAAAALALAQATAIVVWRRIREADERWPALVVPAGSWVVVALPPFREAMAAGDGVSGLLPLWIAGAVLVVATAGPGGRRGWRAAIVAIGLLLGQSVASFAVPLLVALLLAGREAPAGHRRVPAGVWTVAVPVGIAGAVMAGARQLPSLTDGLAMARRGLEVDAWAAGLMSLRGLWAPWWLVVPLLPLAVMACRLMLPSTPAAPRRAVQALMAGVLLYGVGVLGAAEGADPDRLWLAVLFAVVLPGAMWPVRPRRRSAAFSLAAQTVMLLVFPLWAVLHVVGAAGVGP